MRNDSRTEIRPGHNSAENCPDFLSVATGLPDDERRELATGHRLFRRAELAWRRQDAWSEEEHRGFWSALLPEWPSGKTRTNDRLGALAFYLRDRGVGLKEVANVVGVAPDTLRRRLFRRGQLREDETTYSIHGRNFLHPWSLGGAEGPLPRVYSRREQPPTLARYYPAVPDMGAPPLPDALIHASREAHGLGPCEAAIVVLEAPVAGGFAAYDSCPINERLELPFVRDVTSWPRSQLHCPCEDGGPA